MTYQRRKPRRSPCRAAKACGVVFAVAVVSDDVKHEFDRFGLTEAIGEERYFATLDEAIAAFRGA
jgi:hypothetical protein